MTERDPESPRRGRRRPEGLFLGPAIVGTLAGWSCLLAGLDRGPGADGATATWALPAVILGAGLLTASCAFLAWRIVELAAQLADARAGLERLSQSDGLTGTLNHSAFMEVYGREFARCQRYGHPFALLLLDIDFFKRINDGYGHAVGDDVLRAFVTTVGEGLRTVDAMGRLGGKDFAIALPNTGCEAATRLAERLRERVAAIVLTVPPGDSLRFTTSIGLCCLQATDANPQAMLGRAELALREAKNAGRNRVARAPGDVGEAALGAPGAVE